MDIETARRASHTILAFHKIVTFHPTNAIDADAVTQVQTTLRRRILRAFVGRRLLESFETKEAGLSAHRVFSGH